MLGSKTLKLHKSASLRKALTNFPEIKLFLFFFFVCLFFDPRHSDLFRLEIERRITTWGPSWEWLSRCPGPNWGRALFLGRCGSSPDSHEAKAQTRGLFSRKYFVSWTIVASTLQLPIYVNLCIPHWFWQFPWF